MLALIKNNTIEQVLSEGSGFETELGYTSPAQDGWVSGDYSLMTILDADPVPTGDVIVSTECQMVDGEPKYVNVTRTPTIDERRSEMVQLTPRQLRLALLSMGISEAQVDAALVENPAGMIEWKYATYFKRTHPLVESLGVGFSITPEQIDDLWVWASSL